MYLSEFIIINYRSCRNLHIVLDNDYPNILIGINDCGKSSILQAVGLLLTSTKPKFSFASEDKKKNDISNTPLSEKEFSDFLTSKGLPLLPYQKQESVFIGKFVLEKTDVNSKNEDSLSNHLKWTIGNSTDNSLWLARVFDGEKQNYPYYLLTPDTEDSLALYKQSAANLNKYKKDLNVTNDEVENANKVGRFKNIELISAIYKHLTLKPTWSEYALEKNFWLEYRYLDWNFTLDELNLFANDIVTQNITAQIELASRFARRQASKAQSLINQELVTLATSLKEDLHNIKAIQANYIVN